MLVPEAESLTAHGGAEHRHAPSQRLEDLESGAAAEPKRHGHQPAPPEIGLRARHSPRHLGGQRRRVGLEPDRPGGSTAHDRDPGVAVADRGQDLADHELDRVGVGAVVHAAHEQHLGLGRQLPRIAYESQSTPFGTRFTRPGANRSKYSRSGSDTASTRPALRTASRSHRVTAPSWRRAATPRGRGHRLDAMVSTRWRSTLWQSRAVAARNRSGTYGYMYSCDARIASKRSPSSQSSEPSRGRPGRRSSCSERPFRGPWRTRRRGSARLERTRTARAPPGRRSPRASSARRHRAARPPPGRTATRSILASRAGASG